MRSRSWKFVAGGILLSSSGAFIIPELLGTIGYLFAILMVPVGLIVAGLGAFELIFPTQTGPVGELGLSMGEKEYMSKEYENKRTKEAIDAVAAAASVGVEALDTYTEYKKEKQKRRENKRKEQKKQKIKANKKKIENAAQEARKSRLSILWEMNCENCGVPWMTTQDSRLIRNDEFDTIGFKIVNEKEWHYIQNQVRLQCDAPDCNNTSTFTKDSLWDT